jgi:hypothetical protein
LLRDTNTTAAQKQLSASSTDFAAATTSRSNAVTSEPVLSEDTPDGGASPTVVSSLYPPRFAEASRVVRAAYAVSVETTAA